MKTVLLGSLVVAGLVCAVPAPADTVTLNNNRSLQGALLSESPREIVIKTEIGTLRVSRSEIREVVRDGMVPEEVDGDLRRAAGDFDAAEDLFNAALRKVPGESPASQRLKEKLAGIASGRLDSTRADISVEISRVRALMKRGDNDGALEQLNALRPKMTTDEGTSIVRRLMAEAHFGKAMAARDRMNELVVERELRSAIEAYEPFYRAHLVFGELLMRSSVTEKEGIDTILKGLRYGEGEITEEERIKYHYTIAKRYFDKRDFQSASSHFVECVQTKDKYSAYSDAMDLAAESYIRMGEQNVVIDSEKTIENLNKALRLDPNNKKAYFLLGRLYKDTGDTERAIVSFKKVIELDGDYPLSHHFLAQSYLDKRDFDNALSELDKELALKSTNYDALVDRGEVQIELANYEKAATDLEAAIKLEPNRWRAYLLRGTLAYVREEYGVALDNLQKVLAFKPDAIEAHIQTGKVLQAEKNYDAAKKWFDNVVQHLEQGKNLSFKYRNLMADAQTRLGEIDLQQDSPRQAETRFRKALDFKPDFAPALAKIGEVKRRLSNDVTDLAGKKGLYKEAEDYYHKAITADPRNPDYYLGLGILYHKNLKDTKKAVVNYSEYLKRGGKDRANVSKWIDECGGAVTEDSKTTATARAT